MHYLWSDRPIRLHRCAIQTIPTMRAICAISTCINRAWLTCSPTLRLTLRSFCSLLLLDHLSCVYKATVISGTSLVCRYCVGGGVCTCHFNTKYYYCASMEVMTVIILLIFALSLIYSSHHMFWFVIFKQ